MSKASVLPAMSVISTEMVTAAFDATGMDWDMVILCHQSSGNPEAAQAVLFPAGNLDHHRLLPACHEGHGGADPGRGQCLFCGGAAE